MADSVTIDQEGRGERETRRRGESPEYSRLERMVSSPRRRVVEEKKSIPCLKPKALDMGCPRVWCVFVATCLLQGHKQLYLPMGIGMVLLRNPHLQRQAGYTFVSRTTFEIAGMSTVALRAVIANPLTTEGDINLVLDDQIKIAANISVLTSKSLDNQEVNNYEY